MNKRIFSLLKWLDYSYRCGFAHIDVTRSHTVILLCDFLKKEGFIYFYVKEAEDLELYNLRIFLKKKLPFAIDNGFNKFFFNISENPNMSKQSMLFVPFKPYRFLKMLSKPNRPLIYTWIELNKLICLGKLYLVSTDKGFMWAEQAVKLKIGGILICRFCI